MLFSHKSEQSCTVSEAAAVKFIMQHGFHVAEFIGRDTVSDFHFFLDGKVQWVQVKTISKGSNSLVKRTNRSSSKVGGPNSKTRNSVCYAEQGIHWLLGYHVDEDKIYAYHIDAYSKIPSKYSFSVKRYHPCEFPFKEIKSHI